MRFFTLMLFLASFAYTATANETQPRNLCIFDPLGSNGPIYNSMTDYRTTAMGWGINLDLKAYTNEAVALADFQAGICDGIVVTGTRVRPYNVFTGSIEALGGLKSYEQVRELISILAKPNASKYMVDGQYEVAGIMPGGSVYVFVRDRAINSVEAAAGKKIATLEYDMASIKVVDHIGANMVPSTVATFAPRFNNGDVDIAYAPAVAYKPFEMYKGLGTAGGIYRFSLAQMNFQMLINRDRFPENFGLQSRQHISANFDKAMDHVITAENEIPEKYWLDLPDELELEYLDMLASIRGDLAQEGVYDPRMMKLQKKLRCRSNPAHYECAIDIEL